MPSRLAGTAWFSTACVLAVFAGVLFYQHGLVDGLQILTAFLLFLALAGLIMRFVLAIAWKLKFLQTYDTVTLLYCVAYLAWYYTSGAQFSLVPALSLGIAAGLILGLGLLLGASRFGRRIEAAESRLFTAIAKRFRRDDNEA